jgi:hypothetical protein
LIGNKPLTQTEIHARYIKKLRKNKRAYARFRRVCNKWTARWKRNLKNRKRCRAAMNASNERLRIRVLTYYGKKGQLKCCWRNCNVTDLDCLTLDHIYDNGKSHREEGYKGGVNGYRQLERAGYPNGFQTLCGNHQLKKERIRRRGNC